MNGRPAERVRRESKRTRNPGPGGWGAVLIFSDGECELFGGELHTTNNRLELQAAIEALKVLQEPSAVVIVVWDCPPIETLTFSPGEAFPQTGLVCSRWSTM